MTSIKIVTAAVAASVCLHAGWAQEAFNLAPLGGTAAARAAADSGVSERFIMVVTPAALFASSAILFLLIIGLMGEDVL